jgi:hypothetical protein
MILQILKKNDVSKRFIWNDEVLRTRLPKSEYVSYQNLRNERDRHVRIVFNDDARLLSKYNELLTFLGYGTQDTLAAARKAIKKNVFISIYDFLEGRYECHKENLSTFRAYLRNNTHLIYPLKLAKSGNLKLFLKLVFGGWAYLHRQSSPSISYIPHEWNRFSRHITSLTARLRQMLE